MRFHLVSTNLRRKMFFRLSNICFSTFPDQQISEEINLITDQTISAKEMKQFQRFVGDWWRPGGPYDSLRSMNRLRVPFIKHLCSTQRDHLNTSKPLESFEILDVGTGGGILAEPLSRLGGNVLGIDPLEDSIEAARKHAEQDPDLSSLTYKCTDIETIATEREEQFDIVIASEVLEHVNEPEIFLKYCCQAVKPGGHVVITTINRNLISAALVKYVAEYILRIVPEDTHDENKFVTPYEVTDMLRKADMVNIDFKGMMLNPLTNEWSWTSTDIMNYACSSRKPPSN